jgi:hypothetical protein
VGQRGPEIDLSYVGMNLRAAVDTVPYEFDWEASHTASITVDGRPGQVRSATSLESGAVDVAVTWQLADGRYVTVESISALSVADAERYARGLHPGSIPASPTVADFAGVPVGYVLSASDPTTTCFTTPADAVDRRSLSGVCAVIGGPPDSGDPNASPVTVAGRPATITSAHNGPDEVLWTVYILTQERWLNVFSAGTANGLTPLGEADVIAIAGGVTLRS